MHPHRHVLTRALGVGTTAEPDLVELRPSPGATFVLCSDGLSTHLRDCEILEPVWREARLEKACDGLVAGANQRGGIDNVTAVLARFECD